MDGTVTISSTRRGVRRNTALARVITFSQKFGEIYLNLACHAAFPLVLTPDLLYRIWSIFVPQAPWTSVSDILLSSLCREVGYELYEMDLTIREILLQELQQNENYGPERLNVLADFLMEYVARQLKSTDPDEAHLAEAQRWTALAYTRPSTAAREIAMALSKLKPEDEEELFRLSSLVETFATSLNEFGLLLSYTRSMTRLVYGDIKGAAEQIENLPRHKNHVLVAGISLSIPEQIMSEMKSGLEDKASSISTPDFSEKVTISEVTNIQPSEPTSPIIETSTDTSLSISAEPVRQSLPTTKDTKKSIWSGTRIPNVLDRLFGKGQKTDESPPLGCEFSIGDVFEQRFEIEQVYHDSNIITYTTYDRYNREQVKLITYQNQIIWSDELTARFRAEIIIWAQLDTHPNIVSVKRLRTIAGKLYAFAEHLSGDTLRSYVGALSDREVIDFALQICQAMIYANKNGINLHGDLRPENIVVTSEGQIQVSNFGIDRALIIQSWLDQLNTLSESFSFPPNVELLGSRLPYLAPELLRGVSYKDNRMDIYSFGVILYELFTGKLPYDMINTESSGHLRLSEPPPDPRIFKPDLHSGVIFIILRCLSIKQNDRYQSFQDIEDDLQSLYAHLFSIPYAQKWTIEVGVNSAKFLERGLIFMDLGKYKEALHHFHRSVNMNVENPDGWINLAHAHIKLYEYNEAIQVVEEGLRYAKRRSDFAQLYQVYGEAFASLMMLDKALGAFDQALSYTPNAPILLREKGKVLHTTRQVREAQQCFEQAIRYDKFDSYTWLLLGNIYREKLNFKQAYHAYGESLKLDPQSAVAWTRYGTCQLELSLRHEAMRSYEMALRLDPDFEEARDALRILRMS